VVPNFVLAVANLATQFSSRSTTKPTNTKSLEEPFQHFLSLPKIYTLSVGKFMHSYHNKLLPNHFLQLSLIHSSVYIGMLFHLYIFFTMFCVCLLSYLCSFHSNIVLQHFSITEKQGWLTRWLLWSLTNPMTSVATLLWRKTLEFTLKKNRK